MEKSTQIYKVYREVYPRGDALFFSLGGCADNDCSLFLNSNMQFSTKDADNDRSSLNCPVTLKGGWWYNDCSWANLNGVYYNGEYSNRHPDGIKWFTLRGQFYSFKRVEMKVKPKV